jgi:hypothetical protein
MQLTEYFDEGGGGDFVSITHRFKVGQTVTLIPSISRTAAQGRFEIVSLRPIEGETPQYRIKSRSELHERVVAETDLIPSAL